MPDSCRRQSGWRFKSNSRWSELRKASVGQLVVHLADFDLRVLILALGGFALGGFERDFVRLVSLNNSAISETVEMVFFAQIIWVEEAFSDRDNADMNSA